MTLHLFLIILYEIVKVVGIMDIKVSIMNASLGEDIVHMILMELALLKEEMLLLKILDRFVYITLLGKITKSGLDILLTFIHIALVLFRLNAQKNAWILLVLINKK